MSQRKAVLDLYRRLNRIAKEVFDQDARALKEAQGKIRTEFKKNAAVDGEKEIAEKIKVKKLFLSRLRITNAHPQPGTHPKCSTDS
jgi:hypothetical protein